MADNMNERIRRGRGQRQADVPEPEAEPPKPFDYGAGPRGLVHGHGTHRVDGRRGLNAWLHDNARKLATRGETVVIPGRRTP